MQNKIPTFLFVIPWGLEHLGGVNQVVISLGREMKRSGQYDPIVLIYDWTAKTAIWGESHGLRTVRWRIRPYGINMGIKEKVVFALWSWRFYPRFRHFCAEQNVAAINLHFPGSPGFTLERAAKSTPNSPALIFSFHGSDIGSLQNSDKTTLREWKRLLLRSTGVVACSNALGERIRSVFGNEVPVCIAPNGIDTDAFASTALLGQPKLRRAILSVGKFDYIKGQDILIRAFSLLAKNCSDVDLILVGGTGAALPALRKLCADEGVAERVNFHHDVPHERIARFYSEATVFVLPSRSEAFGLVIMEAAAFSLPVVASNVGGIPEAVIDGKTGWLVQPEDPVQLAECIQLVLDNPAVAKERAENLRDLVRTRFTWPATCQKYYALAETRKTSAVRPN